MHRLSVESVWGWIIGLCKCSTGTPSLCLERSFLERTGSLDICHAFFLSKSENHTGCCLESTRGSCRQDAEGNCRIRKAWIYLPPTSVGVYFGKPGKTIDVIDIKYCFEKQRINIKKDLNQLSYFEKKMSTCERLFQTYCIC